MSDLLAQIAIDKRISELESEFHEYFEYMPRLQQIRWTHGTPVYATNKRFWLSLITFKIEGLKHFNFKYTDGKYDPEKLELYSGYYDDGFYELEALAFEDPAISHIDNPITFYEYNNLAKLRDFISSHKPALGALYGDPVVVTMFPDRTLIKDGYFRVS
jgi:hypothetical protein